ncbi:MAG: anthranilate synthase component I [Candidatus Firestonebacteria bacterium]
MYKPTYEEFKNKAKLGNLIPVYREMLADTETPVSAFLKLNNDDNAFLLESVEGGERVGRFSFLGTSPSVLLKTKDRDAVLYSAGKCKKLAFEKDPLELLSDIMKKYKPVLIEGLPPFVGGAVGYINYDTVRFFENLPDKNPDDLNLPDLIFGVTDTILIFDHLKHTIKIVSNAYVDNNSAKAYKTAIKKIENIVQKLNKQVIRKTLNKKKFHNFKMKSNFKKKDFEGIVSCAKEYIKAGDIIQMVPSQRWQVKIEADPFDIYRALRIVNPSPYMFYLKFGDIKLIGSSPEILVKVEDKTVISRPIAGTRPRGINEKQDKKLEKELLADPKEKAEHIMLVDLARNDLGRVCKYGTVVVDEFMSVERYSHVMHISSNVQGVLKKGKNQFDVLRACFPAGTVSGAPKIRAMEIIDELEPTKRGPYAGAIGYFSFSGNLDTCITIRTIVVSGKIAYVQAGAGIVADSVPSKEYEETLNKAKGLIRAIEMAERGLI